MKKLPHMNMPTNIMGAMMCMAFYTLLEHKMLGYTQHRKGPNKVAMMGIMQPLTDALKLMTKEKSATTSFNLLLYLSASWLTLILALLMWITAPLFSPAVGMNYSILLFLMISSCSVYPTMMMGWSSNSKYGLLGAIRSIAQTISYEVSMTLILITILLYCMSWSFQKMIETGSSIKAVLFPYLYLMWSMSVLAETNRAPFDFAEGESELVSGFNTEYAGGQFVLIFMSEYLNIIFICLATSNLIHALLIMKLTLWLNLWVMVLLLSTSILTIRSSYPRLRYDQLMMITWKSFLPQSLMFMMLLIPLA